LTTPQDADTGRLREAARRVVESHGLELFDLQLRRESIGWVLRVIIDRPGGPGTGACEAVGIEDCQRVSQDLGTLLDVEDLVGFDREYTFEVSSPGLDRPLRGEADYRRFEGRLAFANGEDGVSASVRLLASAVRHQRRWTPTALTMIEARTRLEIARRMPIRMFGRASSPHLAKGARSTQSKCLNWRGVRRATPNPSW